MSKCAPMSPELRRLLDRKYGDLFPDADPAEPMIPPSKPGEGDDDDDAETSRCLGRSLCACYISTFRRTPATKLKKIWIEHDFGQKRAIRIDWDNDRHQRIEIEDETPEAIARALKESGSLVNAEIAHGKI